MGVQPKKKTQKDTATRTRAKHAGARLKELMRGVTTEYDSNEEDEDSYCEPGGSSSEGDDDEELPGNWKVKVEKLMAAKAASGCSEPVAGQKRKQLFDSTRSSELFAGLVRPVNRRAEHEATPSLSPAQSTRSKRARFHSESAPSTPPKDQATIDLEFPGLAITTPKTTRRPPPAFMPLPKIPLPRPHWTTPPSQPPMTLKLSHASFEFNEINAVWPPTNSALGPSEVHKVFKNERASTESASKPSTPKTPTLKALPKTPPPRPQWTTPPSKPPTTLKTHHTSFDFNETNTVRPPKNRAPSPSEMHKEFKTQRASVREPSTSNLPPSSSKPAYAEPEPFSFKFVVSYTGPPASGNIGYYHSSDLTNEMKNFWSLLKKQREAWEQAAGAKWAWELQKLMHRRGHLRGRRFCVSSRLVKRPTRWGKGDEGFFACRGCVAKGLLCFTWVAADEEAELDEGENVVAGAKGEFWCLPVHPDGRRDVHNVREIQQWLKGDVSETDNSGEVDGACSEEDEFVVDVDGLDKLSRPESLEEEIGVEIDGDEL